MATATTTTIRIRQKRRSNSSVVVTGRWTTGIGSCGSFRCRSGVGGVGAREMDRVRVPGRWPFNRIATQRHPARALLSARINLMVQQPEVRESNAKAQRSQAAGKARDPVTPHQSPSTTPWSAGWQASAVQFLQHGAESREPGHGYAGLGGLPERFQEQAL